MLSRLWSVLSPTSQFRDTTTKRLLRNTSGFPSEHSSTEMVLRQLKMPTFPLYRAIAVGHFSFAENASYGAFVVHSHQCQIRKQETKLQSVIQASAQNVFSLQFNHMHLPLGPSNIGHTGLWNFLLPPRWRLRDLKVVNPYDNTSETMIEKKNCGGEVGYIESIITNYAVERLKNIRIIDSEGQAMLSSHLALNAKWLELKQNIAGFGLNINAILESIDSFRNKMIRRKR